MRGFFAQHCHKIRKNKTSWCAKDVGMSWDTRTEAASQLLDFLGDAVIRICLPMQGTRVQSLVQEDVTCYRETKPLCTNTEPMCCNS